MTVIDINIDAGESYGAWRMGDDAGTFPSATSVNLACGFHGGDPAAMFAAARLAMEHGLAIGAHPGLPDLVGFGRRALDGHADQAYNDVVYQIGALSGVLARARGDAPPRQAARRVLDPRRGGSGGRRRCRARGARLDPALPLIVTAASQLEHSAAAIGHPSVAEAFPERGYAPSGQLARRGTPGAVITDVDEAARRAVRMATEGKVEAIDGTLITFEPRTLCIHGENPSSCPADLRAPGFRIIWWSRGPDKHAMGRKRHAPPQARIGVQPRTDLRRSKRRGQEKARRDRDAGRRA